MCFARVGTEFYMKVRVEVTFQAPSQLGAVQRGRKEQVLVIRHIGATLPVVLSHVACENNALLELADRESLAYLTTTHISLSGFRRSLRATEGFGGSTSSTATGPRASVYERWVDVDVVIAVVILHGSPRRLPPNLRSLLPSESYNCGVSDLPW